MCSSFVHSRSCGNGGALIADDCIMAGLTWVCLGYYAVDKATYDFMTEEDPISTDIESFKFVRWMLSPKMAIAEAMKKTILSQDLPELFANQRKRKSHCFHTSQGCGFAVVSNYPEYILFRLRSKEHFVTMNDHFVNVKCGVEFKFKDLIGAKFSLPGEWQIERSHLKVIDYYTFII